MNCDKNSLLLYAVTDRAWLQPGETLLGRVRDAIEGGATFVQLREKDLDPAAFLAEGREIGALCREMGVPFVVDDDVDLALACGADGLMLEVHNHPRDAKCDKAQQMDLTEFRTFLEQLNKREDDADVIAMEAVSTGGL